MNLFNKRCILGVIGLIAVLFLTACGGGDVNKVKNFQVGSTTLGKILGGVESFKDSVWTQTEDKQGRKFVIFKGNIKQQVFLDQFTPGNGWGDQKEAVEKRGKQLITEGSFYFTATFEYDPEKKSPNVIESKVVSKLGDVEFSQDINLDSALKGQFYTYQLERKIKYIAFDTKELDTPPVKNTSTTSNKDTPQEVTVRGTISVGTLDSAINDEKGNGPMFLNDTEEGKKIFAVCTVHDLCEVTGEVTGGEYPQFTSVKKVTLIKKAL